MKKLICFLLVLGLVSSCAKIIPSINSVEKELSVHTVFFTVLEDCPEPAKPELCKFSAIRIIDNLNIVDNMTLNGFKKIGIKKTETKGVWYFVEDTEEAERIVDIGSLNPHRSIKSNE